jgi:hypothetical protein
MTNNQASTVATHDRSAAPTMNQPVEPRLVTGINTGVAFPTSLASLREEGAEFLTRAMHAVGALSTDNSVTAIAAFREFFGGGMGRKAVMTVSYARDEPGLDCELFIKITPEFGDPLAHLGALMEPEVRFALLSRSPGFPVRVPHCYFADYSPDPMCGLLITERVRYGEGNVLPVAEKAMDWQLGDPMPYYRALVEAAANLAGNHRNGPLRAEIDRQFPFRPGSSDHASRGAADGRAEIAAKLEKMRAFIASAPNVFPPELDSERFLAELPMAFELKDAIARELNGDADLIALCHWNLNLDNAWFERQADGSLVAGLIDWGSVAQMNIAQCFTGMIICADPEFLAQREGELVELLAARYSAACGVDISIDRLHFLVNLSLATWGIGWVLDAPTSIPRQLPEFASLTSRFDPRLTSNFRARVVTNMLMTLISAWQHQDIGGALRQLARSSAADVTAP